MTENELFTKELLDATFLYCCKRLGNTDDAQELTQDIAVEALRGFRQGDEISHFHAWYWGLARNRYYLFLRMRKNRAVCLGEDGGASLPAPGGDICDTLVAQEEISSLNYAVSRLSQLHREVVIAHYLRGEKIADIARRLDVPEGTVKRRLHDAKQDIRRGMEQMNNTGTMSYAPAQLSIWGGYAIPNYWNNLEDLMIHQIFVACRSDAKTVREIADEIGVAPVYFEDKLRYLLDNRFLKETSNGRYLADFCIFPAQLYADYWYEQSRVFQDVGAVVTDAILACENQIRALDFYGNRFDYNYLMWLLYVYAATAMSRDMLTLYRKKWEGKVPGGNGKDYRMTGIVTFPDETVQARDCQSVGWSNLHMHYQTSGYRHICYANLFQAPPFPNRDHIFSDFNMDLVMRLYEDPQLALSPVQEEQAAVLIQKGYLQRTDGGLFLTMPVMGQTVKSEMERILGDALHREAVRYAEKVGELSDRMLLPHVRKDLLEDYVNWVMEGNFFPIGYILYDAMYGSKTLAIPADYDASAAGTCLYIWN